MEAIAIIVRSWFWAFPEIYLSKNHSTLTMRLNLFLLFIRQTTEEWDMGMGHSNHFFSMSFTSCLYCQNINFTNLWNWEIVTPFINFLKNISYKRMLKLKMWIKFWALKKLLLKIIKLLIPWINFRFYNFRNIW